MCSKKLMVQIGSGLLLLSVGGCQPQPPDSGAKNETTTTAIAATSMPVGSTQAATTVPQATTIVFSDDIDEIRKHLLASSWTSSYRQGSQRVTWYYTYFPEGRVVLTQQTDYVSRTEGTWQVLKVTNGQSHLILKGTEGRDHTLEVGIRYDRTNDSIVLSSLSEDKRTIFARAATVPQR